MTTAKERRVPFEQFDALLSLLEISAATFEQMTGYSAGTYNGWKRARSVPPVAWCVLDLEHKRRCEARANEGFRLKPGLVIVNLKNQYAADALAVLARVHPAVAVES